MKYFYPIRHLIISMLAASALSLSTSAAQAAWGSVRANNHESFHAGVRVEAPRVDVHLHGPDIGFRGGVGVHVDRDFDADRAHLHFWDGVHRGAFFHVLPPGYFSVSVGGLPYFYYDGVYYDNTPSGYEVVPPPVGAVISAPPPGAETVSANGAVYYYAGGAFYVQGPNGYALVAPPIGATVGTLPPDAAPVVVGGTTYYAANGAYFMPELEGGVTVYTTVPPPQ